MLTKQSNSTPETVNAGSANGNGDIGEETQVTQPIDFDTWLAEQPDEIKMLLETHTKGLRSALSNERETRSKLERDLRATAKKAEQGSEMEAQLTRLADQVAESDRKADFYEAAHAAGVANLKLAYLVAAQDDMFDRHGRVNFETMKQSYPELFGGTVKPPRANAGDGRETQPPAAGMNAFIRQAAGRQ